MSGNGAVQFCSLQRNTFAKENPFEKRGPTNLGFKPPTPPPCRAGITANQYSSLVLYIFLCITSLVKAGHFPPSAYTRFWSDSNPTQSNPIKFNSTKTLTRQSTVVMLVSFFRARRHARHVISMTGHCRCSFQGSGTDSLIVSSIYLAQPPMNQVSFESLASPQ